MSLDNTLVSIGYIINGRLPPHAAVVKVESGLKSSKTQVGLLNMPLKMKVSRLDTYWEIQQDGEAIQCAGIKVDS